MAFGWKKVEEEGGARTWFCASWLGGKMGALWTGQCFIIIWKWAGKLGLGSGLDWEGLVLGSNNKQGVRLVCFSHRDQFCNFGKGEGLKW